MSNLTYTNTNAIDWAWKVDTKNIESNDAQIKAALMDLTKPMYVAKTGNEFGVANTVSTSGATEVLAFAQKLNPEDLGDAAYKKQHGVKYAYHGGAMANGIASVELVVALGKAGSASNLVADMWNDALKRSDEVRKNLAF